MFHRPLIPALLSFLAGILFGEAALPSHPSIIPTLALLIALILIVSLFISNRFNKSLFISIFFISGTFLLFSDRPHSNLLPLSMENRKVTIEGTVLKSTKIEGGLSRMDLRAERLFINGHTITISEKILVTVYNNWNDFSPGNRIRFPASLKPIKNFNNPGRYNYVKVMERRGIFCSASVSDGRYIVPLGKISPGLFLEMTETMRMPVRDLFTKSLRPRNSSLMKALILGEKQELDRDIREPFNLTGLGHVLAVSGMHIGLIAFLFFFLFQWILSLSYRITLKGDIRKIAAAVTCVPVIAYTCLSGFQVSGQRAMIMAITYFISIVLGREKEIWSTLALAAFIILAVDPGALFNISFQLSFIALSGILWFSPSIFKHIGTRPVENRRNAFLSRIYLYFSGLTAITLSAVLFTAPITAFYFHRISIVGIPANLTVVPLLGFLILPFGFLSAVFCHISPVFAGLFLLPVGPGLDIMMEIIQFWARFRWASFQIVTPNAFEISLFYCFLFCLFFFKHSVWMKTGILIILSLTIFDISYWIYKTNFNKELKVTYLDVGQGNSALIQFPGRERLLLDGGGFRNSNFDVGEMVIAPFLLHSKILRIDYLVLSHPHPDHLNGLRFIASNFRPKEFWFNGEQTDMPEFEELMDILEREKVKILSPHELSSGSFISGVKIDFLHPTVTKKTMTFSNSSSELNNNSLVLKFSYNGKSFLFTGDIERSGEREVIARKGSFLRSNILLSPHHGSSTSSTPRFLDLVKPDICVISCGKGNSFGLPHPETLFKLNSINCSTLITAETGAIRISVTGDGFDVSTFIN